MGKPCVLLVSANPLEWTRLNAHSAGYTLVAAENCADALSRVSALLPDLVVSAPILPGGDAGSLLERICRLRLRQTPCAAVVDRAGLESIRACLPPACRVIEPSPDDASLEALWGTLSPYDRLTPAGASCDAAQTLLWTLGFSARLSGTAYLADAASLVARDERAAHRLTDTVYPLVARRFAVTPGQVAHGMRRAIESAFLGGSAGALYTLFGNTIDARRDKPTVGEMIARVAEALRTGLERES